MQETSRQRHLLHNSCFCVLFHESFLALKIVNQEKHHTNKLTADFHWSSDSDFPIIHLQGRRRFYWWLHLFVTPHLFQVIIVVANTIENLHSISYVRSVGVIFIFSQWLKKQEETNHAHKQIHLLREKLFGSLSIWFLQVKNYREIF